MFAALTTKPATSKQAVRRLMVVSLERSDVPPVRLVDALILPATAARALNCSLNAFGQSRQKRGVASADHLYLIVAALLSIVAGTYIDDHCVDDTIT